MQFFKAKTKSVSLNGIAMPETAEGAKEAIEAALVVCEPVEISGCNISVNVRKEQLKKM